ncbi:MAG: acetyl-CoA carboxylase biotin carboxyl carrier protein subunit [Chthonomonas sp.]|nr:acetyl-CoA carboxylase biotin carboxyl carrier protein subunit [Chthonomonas sp.]
MKLKITIENKAYEVEVEVAEEQPATAVRYIGGGGSAAPRSAPTMNHAAPSSDARQPDDEGRAVRSPLAGVVSEISVAVGDTVTVDQPVIVLEAMKMFTTITSPVAGKVKNIEVAQTDPVKQGQLLMEFE